MHISVLNEANFTTPIFIIMCFFFSFHSTGSSTSNLVNGPLTNVNVNINETMLSAGFHLGSVPSSTSPSPTSFQQQAYLIKYLDYAGSSQCEEIVVVNDDNNNGGMGEGSIEAGTDLADKNENENENENGANQTYSLSSSSSNTTIYPYIEIFENCFCPPVVPSIYQHLQNPSAANQIYIYSNSKYGSAFDCNKLTSDQIIYDFVKN
jgi:hypothetical protein